MLALKSFSANSDQGPVLQLNEDSVEVDLVHKLYMIFDGFGGSNVGDKAVSEVRENIKKFYTRIAGDPDSTLPFSYSHKYLLEGNALINSMQYAHFLLKQSNAEKDMNSRGGTSAVAIAEAENILTLVSTGNCMALAYSKGSLKTLLMPDNLENLSKDSFNRQFQTIPMSGFGLFDDLHINVSEFRPDDGDLIILLSDGVYARLSTEEIRHIISQEKISSREKIEELFKLSNERGNLDNQSALILQY